MTTKLDSLRAYAKAKGLPDGYIGAKGVVCNGLERHEKNDSSGTVTTDYVGIANTARVDLDREVVIPSGGDPAMMLENRSMFADHQYDFHSGIGFVRAISKTPSPENHKAWKIRFRLTDATEAGRTAKVFVQETGRMGLSIGFFAIDRGPPTGDESKSYGGQEKVSSIVRRWKWFETSGTLMPCNLDAFATEDREFKGFYDDADRLLVKGLISREGAAQLGFPVTPKRKLVRVISELGCVVRAV